MTSTAKLTVRVWDLPTRVFHWLFATCVIGAIVTVKSGNVEWMEWHIRFGIVALTLVVFRIIWGFTGPKYARFSNFVKCPSQLRSYLFSGSSGEPGHTPLGGLSVIAMLIAIGLQAFTGLFISDDILFQGPFYNDVSGATAALMRSIHSINEYVIFALIGLHLLAITLYTVRGKRLISAMVTGDAPAKQYRSDSVSARDGIFVRLWGLALAVVLGSGACWLIDRAASSGMSF